MPSDAPVTIAPRGLVMTHLRLLSIARFRASTRDPAATTRRRLRRAPRLRALPPVHALAGRNAEQFRDAPDDIFLEFVHRAVGVGHVPQHGDDLPPPVFVERWRFKTLVKR